MKKVLFFNSGTLIKLLLIFLVFTGKVSAQEQNPLGSAFNELMLKQYAQGKFHGGALLIDATQKTHQIALGLANYKTGEALNIHHRFSINSIGKMFTAVLIMQLVEEGEISLDDDLTSLLPEYEHPRAKEITLHQLLSHRTGLPDYFMMQLKGELKTDLDESQVLQKIKHYPLDFSPNSAFEYSNTGYLLLGKIILKARNQPFNQVLNQYIFQPLKMTQTRHAAKFYLEENIPQYLMQDGKVNTQVSENLIGDGGQTSNLTDMGHFFSAIYSSKLLKKSSWDLMFKKHSLPSEVPEGAWPPPHQEPYGYGFSIITINVGEKALTMVGHGGAGYGSNFGGRILGTNKVIVLYNNIFKRPVLPDVINYLAQL
ncbi:beta-lactamase family protein [Thalassotalea litorea]|uniref:Beta-lactamase family protein n=1 Tax=Thalassotalea litorea TaxID=2020715 RepID=A0A5R9IF10_9GAMM|nr:serine hydrolase domain-containing protein [Thalassotalea litorea]TLU64115.1 beta-lactamase family protein [Thalassotalea litorea]